MLIMCLLTTASAFKSVPPTNIARFDSFGAARDVLSSKESKVNTFAVEQAAAAVPADAWTNVAPAEVWLTLPSPDDAAATHKLLREGLCTSLRGLSDGHAEAPAWVHKAFPNGGPEEDAPRFMISYTDSDLVVGSRAT